MNRLSEILSPVFSSNDNLWSGLIVYVFHSQTPVVKYIVTYLYSYYLIYYEYYLLYTVLINENSKEDHLIEQCPG
jgi:hypothetical protein